MLTGHQYALLVARYIANNYADRRIEVFREVTVGKSIIGKNRRVDVFVVCKEQNEAFAVECKYQDSPGTVDEKVPYTLQDMEALPMGGCVAYAGVGFSAGVLHMLQASEIAAFCLPEEPDLAPSKDTRELDHLLAMHFGWWDLLVAGREPVT